MSAKPKSARRPRIKATTFKNLLCEDGEESSCISDRIMLYRRGFDIVIEQFDKYKAILSSIKKEYDSYANYLMKQQRVGSSSSLHDDKDDDKYIEMILQLKRSAETKIRALQEEADRLREEAADLEARRDELAKTVKDLDIQLKDNADISMEYSICSTQLHTEIRKMMDETSAINRKIGKQRNKRSEIADRINEIDINIKELRESQQEAANKCASVKSKKDEMEKRLMDCNELLIKENAEVIALSKAIQEAEEDKSRLQSKLNEESGRSKAVNESIKRVLMSTNTKNAQILRELLLRD